VNELTQTLPPALQVEVDSLRDQRDLYRSLLLSEPTSLAQVMRHSVEAVETIRSVLRQPTREVAAFRAKIETLQMELMSLEQALARLQLPTISWRLQHAAAAVHDIVLRADISGNDLLPAIVLLEDLCSHLLIAADSAALHSPLSETGSFDEDLESSENRARRRLGAALQQLCAKLCAQQGKNVQLVAVGLEDIPEAWGSALFDLLGQLLRNTVEHGIEPSIHRTTAGKPDAGTIAIEFIERGAQGYELNVQDDGAGLDAERIAEAGIRLGLLGTDTTRPLDPSRVVNLIFQPGLSTGADAARRGQGMQIVRDHVQRLGGKLHLATKRGQFVRFQITLPPKP
jgi:two-component system, chemotaxis family, sensor kinase CheA